MPERSEVVRIARHEVKITRPEKVLFPEDAVTKRELVDYYRHIASGYCPICGHDGSHWKGSQTASKAHA